MLSVGNNVVTVNRNVKPTRIQWSCGSAMGAATGRVGRLRERAIACLILYRASRRHFQNVNQQQDADDQQQNNIRAKSVDTR